MSMCGLVWNIREVEPKAHMVFMSAVAPTGPPPRKRRTVGNRSHDVVGEARTIADRIINSGRERERENALESGFAARPPSYQSTNPMAHSSRTLAHLQLPPKEQNEHP